MEIKRGKNSFHGLVENHGTASIVQQKDGEDRPSSMHCDNEENGEVEDIVLCPYIKKFGCLNDPMYQTHLT